MISDQKPPGATEVRTILQDQIGKPKGDDLPVIVVVGGGFSGAAFALHLLIRHGPVARIEVFEPRASLGAGVAYSATDPNHRINVPAGKMSLYPDRPESFLTFLNAARLAEADPGLLAPDGQAFPQRGQFARYVEAELASYLADGRVVHRRSSVSRILQNGHGWIVEESGGAQLHADIVVLAATHPSPDLPRALEQVRRHPQLIADVTLPDVLEPIGPDDRVLVVGNGLTAADAVASLKARDQRGPIASISRRGLRARGHPSRSQEAFGDFSTRPSRRASHLLLEIRRHLLQAAALGLSWHAVIDAVRAQGFTIWQALPIAERRRILRHARPFWDAHRFRIAPQVEQVLNDMIAGGQLSILAASIRDVSPAASGLRVTLKLRGKGCQEIDVDWIIVTTGPAHGRVLQSQPFLAQLAAQGVLQPCPTGLGLACDLSARALDAAGQASPSLFVLGPLARGTFGELMGLPQVTEHAILVADAVAEALSSKRQRGGMAASA